MDQTRLPTKHSLGNLQGSLLNSNDYYNGTDYNINSFITTSLQLDFTENPNVTYGRTSATISWKTNKVSTTKLEYAASVAFSPILGTITDPALTYEHYAIISGLTPGDTYYYKITSVDEVSAGLLAGLYTLGSETAKFTTLTNASADSTPPVITPTKLSAAITDSSGTGNITLNSTADLPSSGIVQIGDEKIGYTAISGSDLTGITRGVYNTAAATHIANTPVVAITENSAYIVFTATDDNILNASLLSVKYQVSAAQPASSGYTKESANPTAVSAGAYGVITLDGLVSNTKYYIKLKARDPFGNVQSDSDESNVFYFTTNSDVTPPSVSSGPSVAFTSTTATVTWTASEQVYSKVEYDSTADSDCATATYDSNTTLTTNLNKDQTITLTLLDPSTKYCYRLYMIDTADITDNSSASYTFTTLPEPPTITAVTFDANPSGTSLVITWTTNQKASSLIDYGTDLRYGATQGSTTDSTTSHTVTLVGLAPGTPYKFRVKSINQAGDSAVKDNDGQGYSFTSGSASGSGGESFAIGSVTVPTENAGSLTATSAVIRWTTYVAADGLAMYGTNGTYKFEAGDSSTITHAITLKGLAPSTEYSFKVKSRSGATLLAPATSYTFTTLAGSDLIPPIITSIGVVSVTANTATIPWETDGVSSSYVDYGLESGGIYNLSQGSSAISSNNTHSVQVKGLTLGTYIFRVRSADASGNSAILNGTTFTVTTSSDTVCEITPCRSCQAQTPEVCPVVDITAPVITDTKVLAMASNSFLRESAVAAPLSLDSEIAGVLKDCSVDLAVLPLESVERTLKK